MKLVALTSLFIIIFAFAAIECVELNNPRTSGVLVCVGYLVFGKIGRSL